MCNSNFLVVVAVPDELALAELAARSMEEGIARTLIREPDLNNSLTAVALEPGADARRLCANYPLALKERGTSAGQEATHGTSDAPLHPLHTEAAV